MPSTGRAATIRFRQASCSGSCTDWRTSPGAAVCAEEPAAPLQAQDLQERELHNQIKAAPIFNRQLHASDLCRLIGQAAYDARVLDAIRLFGCPRFTATLAVHGENLIEMITMERIRRA